MDILHLVDRLEELFNESRPLPFSHSVVVNEDRMLDLIDQMRVSIPEEIKKAQQLLAQRDRILAQAQEEANRTLALAREKSEALVGRDSIVAEAQARAEQIIQQARVDVNVVKRESDEYVLETLTGLEAEMERLLSQARNGIRTIQSEKQVSENPAARRLIKRKKGPSRGLFSQSCSSSASKSLSAFIRAFHFGTAGDSSTG